IPKWNLTATFADGAINLSNGVQWKKLDISPTYTDSASGRDVGVIERSDTTALEFVDANGGISSGYWISPTQVAATTWGKTGSVKNGQIVWSDGAVWNKNLVVVGVGNGAGPGVVTVTVRNNQVLLTNKLGTVMQARIIDPFTLFNIDTGQTIIRKNGRLEF